MESVKSLKSRDQLARVEDATEWHQERSFQTCVEGTPTETAGHSTVFKNRKGLKSYKMCSPTEPLTLNLNRNIPGNYPSIWKLNNMILSNSLVKKIILKYLRLLIMNIFYMKISVTKLSSS